MSKSDARNSGETITKLLRGITDKQAWDIHPIDDYARAFDGSAWQATALLHVGGDTVVLELASSTILKITGTRILEPDMGSRSFDCPILQRGCWFHIQWFTQPKAATPVSIQELERFCEEIKPLGYWMWDRYPENLGRYEGRVCLLDPWAVRSPIGYS